MKIEQAKKSDSKDLTELTIRSKSHWNYSKEQIDEWREVLTVSENYILEKEVYKLTNNNNLIGYYSYFKINELDVKMENLFIEPKFINQGFGKILMTDFLQRIQKLKYKRVLLDADPNVEKFYERIGFKVIGRLNTTIKNRFSPIMEMKILSTLKEDNN